MMQFVSFMWITWPRNKMMLQLYSMATYKRLYTYYKNWNWKLCRHFSADLVLQCRKYDFLKNETNKKCIYSYWHHICMILMCWLCKLQWHLQETKAQLWLKKTQDLLIRLLHYVKMEADDLFLAPEPNSHQQELEFVT